MSSDIGLIGLGVMGASLACNFANHKFKTSVFNRTTEDMEIFIKKHGSEYLVGQKTLKEFIKSLKRPRKIIVMIKAGPAVDAVIKSLRSLLDKGDIIIDCGNSNYHDTMRRYDELKKVDLNFVGCGVSGGAEGALNGPSMMPGGSRGSWRKIQKMFETVAARDFAGEPCVTYIGDNGAGHYVKMVHNGIEYAIMQLMAETYSLYRKVYHLPAPKISKIFSQMNRGKLGSYLFEIAVPVLAKEDVKKKKNHDYLIYKILDKAGNKGTGKWISLDALERGVALPTITQAVFSRYVSTEKKERVKLNKIYKHSHKKTMLLGRFNKTLDDALYAAIFSIYAQGFDLIERANEDQKWEIDLAEVSRIWEGGCIIRAKMLGILHQAYKTKKNPGHVFTLPNVVPIMKKNIPALRKLVSSSVPTGINIPGFSSSLYYFESMIEERLPANFIQGLRDYFGAHTYERTDSKGTFHTDW